MSGTFLASPNVNEPKSAGVKGIHTDTDIDIFGSKILMNIDISKDDIDPDLLLTTTYKPSLILLHRMLSHGRQCRNSCRNLYELYSQGTFSNTTTAHYDKLVALTASIPAVRLTRFVLLHR